MMAGSEHTDNALHSQLSTHPHSPVERWQRKKEKKKEEEKRRCSIQAGDQTRRNGQICFDELVY